MGRRSPRPPSRGAEAPADLAGWLQRLERAHPQAIDLGLERVAAVGRRLGLLEPAATVLTVGGTNGKGSVAAALEALLRAAGRRPGVYTSPHLARFNERVRIDGREAGDEALVAALERVEAARAAAGVSLTYFEHGTLAAFDCFERAGCDAWVLEVGLGGRLDAVNAVDADVAVVTSVGLDHTDLLGDDLAGIAAEKAGVFRPRRPAVIGQPAPPPALLEQARRIGALPFRAGREFTWTGTAEGWSWHSEGRGSWRGLPAPAAPGGAAQANAATALAAFAQLPEAASLGSAPVAEALAGVRVPGRLERRWEAGLEWLLDVAHNADGAAELERVLAGSPAPPRCHAVFAAAQRKEPAVMIEAVAARVDHWYLPRMPEADMHDCRALAAAVAQRGGRLSAVGDGTAATLEALRRNAGEGDRVLVFGSFRTVAAVRAQQGWG